MITPSPGPAQAASHTLFRRALFVGCLVLVCVVLGILYRSAVGESQRPEWSDASLRGRGFDRAPFQLIEIPQLRLHEPVDFEPIPGTGRGLIVQQDGSLLSARESNGQWQLKLIGDLGIAAYSVIPGQDFSSTGAIYVTVALEDHDGRRAEVRRLNLDPDSLALSGENQWSLISWPIESLNGHIGGGLAFDSEGMLCIGIGDTGNSSGSGVAYEVGQDLLDLRGKIARLDVSGIDHGGSLIPDGNPFVGTPDARPEILAYGLRNPWKLFFDPSQERILAFDVGEDLWESVYEVRPGANYGWPLFEGGHPFRTGADGAALLPQITLPIIQHPHVECRAIVGGTVYSGERHPSLQGQVIYGDYASGALFAAFPGGPPAMIALSGHPLTDIASDESGELLILSHDGSVFRLATADGAEESQPFPERLSETGLFTSTSEYKLAPGVIDYDVNSPLYADGAKKRRHLAVPDQRRITFSANHPWTFPDGTLLVKSFLVGAGIDERRLETRLLRYERSQWRGYSYRWTDDQSEALLVDASGSDAHYVAEDGSHARWHFPSRMECMMCHTFGAGFVLGANTRQLNRSISAPHFSGNQLEYFEANQMFDAPLPRLYRLKGLIAFSAVDIFPRIADPADQTRTVEDRAVAYLQANCGHCHCPLGGGNSAFHIDSSVPPSEWNVVGQPPLHDSLGLDQAMLVAPGAADRSLFVERMRRGDALHMPKIGTSRIDDFGVSLVDLWITRMPSWNPRDVESPTSPNAGQGGHPP